MIATITSPKRAVAPSNANPVLRILSSSPSPAKVDFFILLSSECPRLDGTWSDDRPQARA
jgi:hypothetical protein